MSMNISPAMIDPSMKKPLIASGGFHVIVMLLVSFGIPFVAKSPPMIINTPMMIEIVDFAEFTQTNKVKPPEPKPIEKPKPPKMTEEQPPDLFTPPPQPEKPVEKLEQAELVPPPEAVKVKKSPPKKPQHKPKPKVTKVAKETPQRDFASLLKNFPLEDIKPVEEEGQITRLADRLTVNEIDALRHQLGQCWSVMAGARDAQNLIVEVRVSINPDRTVRDATILDKGRYNRDSFFKAAADASLRALRNPNCSPLKLPENKYDSWKTTVIRFDPSQML